MAKNTTPTPAADDVATLHPRRGRRLPARSPRSSGRPSVGPSYDRYTGALRARQQAQRRKQATPGGSSE